MQKPKTLKDLTHDLLAAKLASPMDAQGRTNDATTINRLDIMVGTHDGKDPREYLESTMALMRALHIAEVMHQENSLATVHADPGTEYCGWALTLQWNHVPTMIINLGAEPSEIKDFYNSLYKREWFVEIPTPVQVLIDFGGVLSDQSVFFATMTQHPSSGLLAHFLQQGGYDAVNNQALSGGIDQLLDIRPIGSVDLSQELQVIPYELDTRVSLAQSAIHTVDTHQGIMSRKADSLLGYAKSTTPFQPQRLHPETLTTEQSQHLQALLGLQADEAQALVTLADTLAKGRTESFASSTEATDVAGRLESAIQDHLVKHVAPKLVVFQMDPTDPDPATTFQFLQERILETGSLPGAMAILRVALHNDEDYAWSWHCNIAMAMRDQGVDCMAAQRGAASFLQILTMGEGIPGVDTTQFEAYKAIERQYHEQCNLKE